MNHRKCSARDKGNGNLKPGNKNSANPPSEDYSKPNVLRANLVMDRIKKGGGPRA